MTRDEIICLVVEADAMEGVEEDGSMFVEFSEQQLKTFTALVAAHEREACAKVAESYEPTCDTCPNGVANAIRARGEA